MDCHKPSAEYPEEWYISVMQWRMDLANGCMKESYPHLTEVFKTHCFIEGINSPQLDAISDRSYEEAFKNDRYFVGWSMGEFRPGRIKTPEERVQEQHDRDVQKIDYFLKGLTEQQTSILKEKLSAL